MEEDVLCRRRIDAPPLEMRKQGSNQGVVLLMLEFRKVPMAFSAKQQDWDTLNLQEN